MATTFETNQCVICSEEFVSELKLCYHIGDVHLDLDKTECKYCNKKLKTNQCLIAHVNSVHLKIKIPCKYCSKKLHPCHLTRHIKEVHLKQKKFKCHDCGRGFGQKRTLKRHFIGVHTNIKNYKCDVCESRFSLPEQLKSHIKVHDKPDGPKKTMGEKLVMEILDKNNADYFFNTSIDSDLIGLGGKPLRFDFIIHSNKYGFIFIEFDGQQHFRPVTFNGISREEAIKNYKRTIEHDGIKNKYVIDNGFKLLRLRYDELENIEANIIKFLNKYS